MRLGEVAECVRVRGVKEGTKHQGIAKSGYVLTTCRSELVWDPGGTGGPAGSFGQRKSDIEYRLMMKQDRPGLPTSPILSV